MRHLFYICIFLLSSTLQAKQPLSLNMSRSLGQIRVYIIWLDVAVVHVIFCICRWQLVQQLVFLLRESTVFNGVDSVILTQMMGLNFLTIKVHRCAVMLTVVEVDGVIAQGHCSSCQEMLWRAGTGCKKNLRNNSRIQQKAEVQTVYYAPMVIMLIVNLVFKAGINIQNWTYSPLEMSLLASEATKGYSFQSSLFCNRN